ncbi:hypothetical protein [Hugenholtzia roseola]|uniref:hypothetical protein n=1 Tax=Hugenholtzia roseola TaxID=1002 RepID=UPI000411A4E0|nr:hypothetical protein [Hugenholtzia roseola]
MSSQAMRELGTEVFVFGFPTLRQIAEKESEFISVQDTLNKVRRHIKTYNIDKPLKKQVRLNAANTVLNIYESFINSFNKGDTQFIRRFEGEINGSEIQAPVIIISKWLAKHNALATCLDERTAAAHVERAFLCKGLFLATTSEDKRHRFDQNVGLVLNPQFFYWKKRYKKNPLSVKKAS